jgi:chemotaxis methyl-accepting protein methylase
MRAAPTTTASISGGDLHVAGIGASAGGLEAMLPLFARLRATGRVAYVVAQHMAHDGHGELVARLLGRAAALPVVVAQDGTRLQADTIYVIPAGQDGSVATDRIALRPPAPDSLSTPSASVLFASIAASQGPRGIGIVLSGTGGDGVAGCRALKAGGGLTIAQEPAEAKFDGMPRAAIDARLIDHVLPVEAIAGLLASLYPGAAASALPRPPPGMNDEAPAFDTAARRELERLLPLVFDATGIDFSSYKEDTLLRRLEKRKATLGIAGADEYLRLARRSPDELRTLQQMFLVSVSGFFRDRASFRALEHALVVLLAEKAAGEPVAVWVPGCASGDEAYTLAIVLSELLGPELGRHPVQVVGTDLNAEALATARAGIYRHTACVEMDPALVTRHLLPKGQHYEVAPALRALVRFEQRDALVGAPLAPLDLVSCRNLLIYMKGPLQERLIACCHRALRPHGLLFIGPSESLGAAGEALFSPVDHYHRLFRRRD